MGIEQAIIEHVKEKSRLEGEYQKALKTAEKCLLRGINAKDVADITELPLEIIQEIAKNLGK
jgi:predicted methyltransferase